MTAEVKAAAHALAALGITLDVAAFSRSLKPGAQNLTDLALAFACASGDEVALLHFEKTHLAATKRALRKLRLEPSLIDDVMSWVRFELFARDKGGLISTYSGRGDLHGWVRAIAVHRAMKDVKKQRRDVTPEAAAELPMPEVEFAAMRGAYGPQFTKALEESFRALSVEQRNLLRQYFLDGLTIDALAGLHHVHRATAARRVAAAREELVTRVKAKLREELSVGEETAEQVVTLSNLQESLGTLLRRTR